MLPTEVSGSMMSNRQFFFELNGKKIRWRNQKMVYLEGVFSHPCYSMSIQTTSMYTMRHAAPSMLMICVATQRSTFEQTETILTEALHNLDEYYERNHLRANHDKTQTYDFHLKNREASRKLNITYGITSTLSISPTLYICQ